jgi:hypothetical protein
MNMIDPKQGPLFCPGRSADLFERSRPPLPEIRGSQHNVGDQGNWQAASHHEGTIQLGGLLANPALRVPRSDP